MEGIERELARIGVVWPRGTFLICRTHGQSPKTIAHHVAEMWFLYTHTGYFSFRPSTWPSDMVYSRPCFEFDEALYQQVDRAGRKNALKEWVYRYRPRPEDAVDFPGLPSTMQQEVLYHAVTYQFDQWVRTICGKLPEKDYETLAETYVHSVYTKPLLPRQDAFAFFDSSFGTSVLKSVLVQQMKRKVEFLCAKYSQRHKVKKQSMRAQVVYAATKILEEWSCMPVYMATTLVAITNVLHHDFKILSKKPCVDATVGRQLSDIIEEAFCHYDDVTVERVRLFEMSIKHGAFVYCCNELGCRYVGNKLLDLGVHAKTKHGIDDVRQINATQSTDTLEARFKDLVKMRGIVLNNAARTIQRRWRVAISCPEYTVCRKRLQREFDDLKH